MEFCQTRTYGSLGLSYELRFTRKNSQLKIAGTIEIETTEEFPDPEIGSYEFTNELKGEIQAVNQENSNLVAEIEVRYSNESTQAKLLIDIANDLQKERLHIPLPPLDILELYGRLLRDEIPALAYDQLDTILDQRGGRDAYTLIETAPYALNRTQLFDVIDAIAEYEPSLKRLLRNKTIGLFLEWIFQKSTGKYYSVDSVEELQNLAREYQSRKYAPSIDEPVLDEIIKRREEYIGRGFNGFVIDNLASSVFPYHQLSTKASALMLSYLGNNISGEELRAELAPHSGPSSDTKNISDCFEDDVSNTVECLYEQIPNTARNDDAIATRYAVARFLEIYLRDDRSHEITPQATAYMHRAIINLSKGTNFEWLAERSQFERHNSLARDTQETNPTQAVKHLDQAIHLLTQAEDWDPSVSTRVWAVYKKSSLEVEACISDGRYEEAIDLLEERAEVLKAIDEDGTSHNLDRYLLKFKGRQHELRADQLLNADQFERARKLYDEAASAYKQAGDEGLFKGVIGRKYQIDALLAELEGDFREAADLHQRYCEELPDSAGARFHQIRRILCMAKAATFEGRYSDALDRIDTITGELNVDLSPRQQQFQHLLEAAREFERGEVNLDKHIQALISQFEHDESRLLSFTDDYSTGLLTVLSAQRLRSLPVREERISELVDLAVMDACYPKAPKDRDPTPPKRSVSPVVGESNEWELALPTHVINKLERIRVKKQTTFDEYASLVSQLGVATEQTLALLREYYGKQQWGSDWKSSLPGEGRTTVGDLYQFFKMEEATTLNASDEVINLFESEIVGTKLVKQLRDALAHGRNPNVSDNPNREISMEQFETIFDAVVDVLRVATTDLPVLGIVDSQFSNDTYMIRLQWGGLPKQVWITTSRELQVDELYFFPRENFETEYGRAVDITGETIERCDGERARSHLLREEVS